MADDLLLLRSPQKLVQESDGTSLFTLEDGSGSILLEAGPSTDEYLLLRTGDRLILRTSGGGGISIPVVIHHREHTMGFGGILKQSTQIKVRIGPFVDATDGVTPETGVALGTADQAELLKADGAATVDISAATWAAVTGADGWYDLTLTTSHTDTVGELAVVVQDSSLCLPVVQKFHVVEEAVYDAMYGASAAGPLQSTTAGRKLDVAATGEAGLDFGNVTGTLSGGQFAAGVFGSGAITAASIASSAITSAKFGSGAITSTVLADSAITANKIAASAITSGKFAANAITSTVVADNTITAAKIASAAITSAKFGSGAITSTVIAASAIGASQIATDAIDADALATDAVNEINATVDTALSDIGLDHLVSTSVTGTDIADNSIVAKLVSASATADWDDFVNTTDSLQAIRDNGDSAWITATGFSTHTAANVRTEMDSNSTQLAAIVADTNELQGDWTDGGRLDVILDAVLVDTAEIGAAGAGLTDLGGMSTTMKAEVNAEVVDVIRTDEIPDSYATDGSQPTIAQAILAIQQFLQERAVSGTTVTVKKPDGSTSAMTFTLDDGTSPTSITRAS